MKAKKEEPATATEQSELEAALTEAKEIIAEQNVVIENLQAQAKAAPAAKNIVNIDGLQYQVRSGGKIKGKTMSAEEIAADIDLVVLLIKLKSNLVCALN